MISVQDLENLSKSERTAGLLAKELRAVSSSRSALLADAALDLLVRASELQKAVQCLRLAAESDAEEHGNPE